jgi:aminoglycoside phosphotransferase (APT) family kinase protein
VPALSVHSLVRWFADQQIPLSGVPTLTLIAGGRSNLTFDVTDEAGHHYVLRRPPTSGVLETAHDVAREYRLITALRPTPVPVPPARGLCADPEVIGAPFYVMNFVDGYVLADPSDGAELALQARRAASQAIVDTLGTLHLTDVAAIGLGDLSVHENYAQRQLRRWLRQFNQVATRDLGIIHDTHRRLAESAPRQRYTGLVHGDFRPGNLILGRDGAVRAVLDWELSTLGDTLADLGWLTATWTEPGEAPVMMSPTGHDGYLARTALAQRYHDVTGHDVSDLPWYEAFALWRLACIGEGVYARYKAGAMGDDGFDIAQQAAYVVVLAEAAHERLTRI